MSTLTYPSSLPCPKSSTVTPAERRALSNAARPREARALARDRLEVEKLEFPPMTPPQFAAFRAWWETDIILGGAWFAADWPLPRGMITAVRKFIGAPVWSFIPGGFWRITAMCQVRGRGELPLAPLKFVDCELLLHFDEAERGVWIDYSTRHHGLSFLEFAGSTVASGPGVFVGGLALTQVAPGSGTEPNYNSQSAVRVAGLIDLGGGEFFMTARVNVASVEGAAYAILSNTEGQGGGQVGFQFLITAAGAVGFGYTSEAINSAGSIPLGEWVEVAVSRVPHSPNDRLYFFINGAVAGLTTTSGNAGTPIQNRAYVGAHDRSTATGVETRISGFQGGIDELFVIKGPGTGRSASYTVPTGPFT